MNSEESLKFLKEIVIPYMDNERCQWKLPKEQKALIVMDVFTGHIFLFNSLFYVDTNFVFTNLTIYFAML